MASKKHTREAATSRTSARQSPDREEAAQGTAAKPSQGPFGNLLDMNKTAARLGVSRPTLYRWLRSGKLRGRKVGRQWRFEPAEVERFLKGEQPQIELRTDIKPLLKALEERAAELDAPAVDLPTETPVQQAISLVLRVALALEASDIHIAGIVTAEKAQPAGNIRFRVDGVLQNPLEFDLRLLPAIAEQIKILAACDPSLKHRPQDGRILFNVPRAAEDVDLRLSFYAAVHGEAITIRVLRRGAVRLEIDRLGYSQANTERLLRALGALQGMVVSTGPTGSGKTTAMYACLNQVSGPHVKTVSVEDPVEYVLPWTVQAPIRPQEGATFARLVRSMFRSDPDIILIGEIREGEVLNLAAQAALTGHLVLTQLHAEDAPSALVRMVDMGCPAFVLGDAARLILSQRLVRILCPACSREAPLGPADQARARTVATKGGLDADKLPSAFREAVGCQACGGLGYRGRTTIAEMLEVTPEIARALRAGEDADALRRIAVSEGMVTMAADGVRKAAEGLTTLAEVRRVLALR